MSTYSVGEWLVDPKLQRVSNGKTAKNVEPRLMLVLQYLVLNHGQVVTKKELIDAVWTDVVITENVLTRAISSLRKLLDDNLVNPIYIETISKTGYRFIGSITRHEIPKRRETFTIELTRRPLIIVTAIILLIALGAFATRSLFLSILSEKLYSPIALANHSNSEYWPAISPDGKFIAYAWKGVTNDNWDIYAKLIGAETTLRITTNPHDDLRAKWSFDGNYIYYLRYENGGSTIYKKSLFGENEARVIAAPDFSFGEFDISPDEKWIAFNDREDQLNPLRLKLISLETDEQKWLTNPEKGFNGDIHPTFSPDGLKLAFIREKNSVSMTLWSFTIISGEIEQVTSSNISINGFDWSTKANSLFYASDQSGLYKLWEVNLGNKESNIVPVGDYQMVMPRVAQNGRMVYAKMKDNVNIWSYDLTNKIAEPWRSTNDLSLNPVFAPNGARICFTMKNDRGFQIWVADSDGSKAVPITNFTGEYLSAPRWSPDSQTIVFQGFWKGSSDIYKVNALGGVSENLTQSEADDHTPVFGNRNQIYFSSNRTGKWGIWKMDDDGTHKVQVLGNNAFGPQINKAGTTLFYSKKQGNGLWSYNVATGEEQLITESFHPMYWGAFAVADGGLYYLNAKNNSFEYFEFKSGKSSFVYQPLARIPRLGITMNLSPDSRHMLFSQIDEHDADIMLLVEE